jgi:hypothetical protein
MGLLGPDGNKIIEEHFKDAREEIDKLKHQAAEEYDVAIPLKMSILKRRLPADMCKYYMISNIKVIFGQHLHYNSELEWGYKKK